MGTNYYAVRSRPTTESPIHIGKSSVGWMFLFQEQYKPWNDPPVHWSDFDEVKAWLKKYTVDSTEYVIIDEYDKIVSYDEFINDIVEWKQNDEHSKSNPDNFDPYTRNVNGYRFTDGDFC